MKHILVAVDEHPHAEQIVGCAIEMAQEMAAKILLIYVVDKSPRPRKVSRRARGRAAGAFLRGRICEDGRPVDHGDKEGGSIMSGGSRAWRPHQGNPHGREIEEGGLHNDGGSRTARPTAPEGHQQRVEERYREGDHPRDSRAVELRLRPFLHGPRGRAHAPLHPDHEVLVLDITICRSAELLPARRAT